jgi:phosphohistidine phosphatase
MRRLTLMRHGEARWKDAETEDFARPLSRRGISGAEAMGERLRELGLIPDRLLTSPAHRTEQTAYIISRELALPPRHVVRDEGLYLAGARDLMRIVRSMGPRIAHLMIIGHNPGISDLAQLLAPEAEPQGLTDAALCSIAFDTDQWSSVGHAAVSAVCRETPPTRFARWFG